MMDENEQSLEQEYGLVPTDAPAVAAAEGRAPEAEEMETQEQAQQEAMTGEPAPEEATGGEGEAIVADAWAPLIAQLQSQGINSAADLDKMMAAQQAEQQVAGQVQQELDAYATDLQSRIDNGTLDPDTATEMYALKHESLQAAAKAEAASLAAEMAQQNAAQKEAMQALGKVSPELVQSVGQLGLSPEQVQGLAQVLGDTFARQGEKAVSQYVAQKKDAPVAPVSEGGITPGNSDAPIDYRQYSAMELADMEARGRRR